MAISVADVAAIPSPQLQRLNRHRGQLLSSRYVDDLLKVPELLDVIRALNEICIRDGVVGLHFTRAFRASIEADGLLIKPGVERREAFLDAHGHNFTAEQQNRIRQAWADYFPGQQDRSRNGRICFALTQKPLHDGGAKPLLDHFGGETIYMPLTQYPDIAQVLSSLGEPLIVRCALDPNRSRAHYEYPWGTVWLSSYHRSINPDAGQLDQDVSALYSVPPSDIISIANVNAGL